MHFCSSLKGYGTSSGKPEVVVWKTKCIFHAQGREEQDLLEILVLELVGVKTPVSILIEPSLAAIVLLASCLV